jgi:predicted metal-binding membrane protein
MQPAAASALERNVILALLLLLAGLSWLALVVQGNSAADMVAMSSPTMGMGAPLFLVTWTVMMVAMMFPTAAPMILTFHKVQADRRRRDQAFVATWVFLAGYMLVWSLSGVVAWVGAVAAETVAAQAMLTPATEARIGGGILVVAGLYQLTPLKDMCLSHCRTPMGFMMTSWRDGKVGALRMGVIHGGYCFGCCWLLFAIMFPLGVMYLPAMAAITLVVLAEKTLPSVRPFGRIVAVGLVLYGAAVIAFPHVLPTYVPADAMKMPMSH